MYIYVRIYIYIYIYIYTCEMALRLGFSFCVNPARFIFNSLLWYFWDDPAGLDVCVKNIMCVILCTSAWKYLCVWVCCHWDIAVCGCMCVCVFVCVCVWDVTEMSATMLVLWYVRVRTSMWVRESMCVCWEGVYINECDGSE